VFSLLLYDSWEDVAKDIDCLPGNHAVVTMRLNESKTVLMVTRVQKGCEPVSLKVSVDGERFVGVFEFDGHCFRTITLFQGLLKRSRDSLVDDTAKDMFERTAWWLGFVRLVG
jgi:hypothetical protein